MPIYATAIGLNPELDDRGIMIIRERYYVRTGRELQFPQHVQCHKGNIVKPQDLFGFPPRWFNWHRNQGHKK